MLRRLWSELGHNNVMLMLGLFVWALGEGLWYHNFRQIYLAQLGATPEQIGLALAIESVVKAAMMIPAGYIGDRIGPYRVVIASWLLGIVGTLILIPARTWQWALPGLVTYAASTFVLPAMSSFALMSIPDKSLPNIQQRVLTAIYAAYPAGLILSPVIGGLIADQWGIRSLLWISVGLFIASLLIILLTRHIDPIPAEHHTEHPRDLLRNRRFLILSLYFCGGLFAIMLPYALAPNFFASVRQFSLSDIGFVYAAGSLGTVIFNLVTGRVPHRWSYPLTLVIIWLGALGAWQLGAVVPAAIAFMGLSAGWSARILATSDIATVVQPENRGVAFGALETVFALGGAGAAWLAGQLFATDPGLPFIAGLATLPIMAALWYAVRPLIGSHGDKSHVH